ncbi:hypothetical protein HPO96_26780 [Kribbella sandramycini]|uniref:Uncharacterized protein n=1 Tax=Kribbella sandramycini TaxID=60450 RepID=A0A7Y4L3T5_9ACTN|nr:hypothetical protein [Kribbella sandramycini]MBB6570716.1 hypothetical protein [Kribbella sandramycini]NOL43858.1 hypothetical protein [Kribbella sandramycini]
MDRDRVTQAGFYWSLDLPGLTELEAREVQSVVNEVLPDRQAILVDPLHFLSLSLDKMSVESLRDSLSSHGDAVSSGLREMFEEWIEVADYS